MEVAQYSTVKPASGEFPKQHVTRVNAPNQTRNKAWVAFHLLFPETHALDAKALVAANSFSCFLVCQTGRDVWVYARYANTSSQKTLSLPAGFPHAEMDTYIFGRQNPTLTKVTQTIAQAIGAAEMLEGTLKTLRAEEEVWSWEGMMSALDGVTVVQFTAMAANAILAKARQASTPFQEALVSLEVKLRDYVSESVKASGTITSVSAVSPPSSRRV